MITADSEVRTHRPRTSASDARYGLPGASGSHGLFTLLAFEPGRYLILGWRPNDTLVMTWAFVLNEVTRSSCRLVVRAREGAGYHFHALPRWLTAAIGPVVHFIMQRKQLLGIKRRAESPPADTLVSADRSLSAERTLHERQS